MRHLPDHQILGVTCDNAYNNDTMLDEMTELLPKFDGQLARVRCFAHVLNLIAKSLISEFDARVDRNENEVDEEELRELRVLTEGEEEEEVVTRTETAAAAGNNDEGEAAVGDDDVDDEVDPMAELTPEQRAQFDIDVRPVKLILAKVSAMHMSWSTQLKYSPEAPQAFLQDNPLDHPPLA